jgi:apolipoprotein N-acyltransferase
MPSTAAQPGPGERYVKRHPVPFGEYIPLRSIARAITDKVDLVARDMIAGSGNGLLTQTPVPLGDVICFEVAYDSLVRSSVAAGAQLLVVQTNNATFGFTDESEQQLAMSRLRAVEFGRTVVVAATSGISAIVAPDGSLVRRSQLFTPDTFVEEIAQRGQRTVAARLGAAPEWALTALGAGAVLAVVLPALSSRRKARRQAP